MPILTPDGLEEFLVEEILDSRRCGRGWQYLVQWVGYDAEHDHWLSGSTLEDCEALDRWLELQDTGEATR
jgi:Chromo (CHRromatin Organisation MOdifier) domain